MGRAEKVVRDLADRQAGGVEVLVNGESGVYRLDRAILAALAIADPTQPGGGFEAELGEELARSYSGRTHGGLLILPQAVLETGTATAGAELVFEQRPRVAGALRPVPQVVRLGAQVLMNRDVLRVVRVTGGGGVTWREENPGSDVAEDDLEFAEEPVPLKEGTIATAWTRRLAASNPETAVLVERELRRSVAQALDAAAVAGDGVLEPEGLVTRADVQAISLGDPDGGPLTADAIAALEEAPAAADVDELASGYLATPGVRRELRATAVLTGADPVWRGSVVYGHRALVSSAVPSDLTKGAGTNLHAVLYAADWTHLLLHVVMIELVVDPFTLKRQGIVQGSIFLYCGVGLGQPASFRKIVDADLS